MNFQTSPQIMTPEESHLKKLMQFWTLLFLSGGLLFLFLGDHVIRFSNMISARLFPSLPLSPIPTERFWTSLTVSMMATITAICYYIQKDILRNIHLTSFILISKFVSTMTLLGFYFLSAHYFSYLVGSVFCDGIIFVITFIFYRRALMSRVPPCMKAGKTVP